MYSVAVTTMPKGERSDSSFAATRNGTISWDSSEPVKFEPSQRYLVVVHAVLNG